MLEILNNKNYMLDLCVRMAHHSTAIEGNTLSQDETASIILDGYISRPIKERELYEVRNYKNILPM
ncbi:Fic family protein, partial [Campylobacter upsaliensis]|nr:Fic family protein [Campylobacter upsaliensis]